MSSTSTGNGGAAIRLIGPGTPLHKGPAHCSTPVSCCCDGSLNSTKRGRRQLWAKCDLGADARLQAFHTPRAQQTVIQLRSDVFARLKLSGSPPTGLGSARAGLHLECRQGGAFSELV